MQAEPLAALHAQSLRQCEALWRLVLCVGHGASAAYARAGTAQMAAWFDGPDLVRHQGDAAHGELRAQWLRVREGLRNAIAGNGDDALLCDADAFIRATREHIAKEAPKRKTLCTPPFDVREIY